MATFTKNNIQSFYDVHEDHITVVLNGLETPLIRGRDKLGIPIYLSRQRVKSIDSLYLKTKRKAKYNSLTEVTDIAGLRNLCLFTQDILGVHEYLVKVLKDGAYNLTEFIIYNWDNDNYIQKLKDIVQLHFPNHDSKDATRGSGYKSLHYVVTQVYAGVTWPIEIQLRTLLQDVWGELEHALAYKHGNIHPHIRHSFRLLALDLENIDALMSHLRDIRDKEYDTGLFALEHAGPSTPFSYEEQWLPTVFTEATPLGNAFHKYTTYIGGERDYLDLKGWADKSLTLYDAVEQLTLKDRKDPNVQYWLLMERAYVLFVSSDHDKAVDLYKEAMKTWPERYMPYFRLGELYFIKGAIVEALELFDRCEEKLLAMEKEVAPFNYLCIESRLSEMYWLIGEQYYDVALRKMQKAEQIYKEHYEKISMDVKPHVERAIANSLCWYYLEIYILAKERGEQSNNEEDRKLEKWAYGEAARRYNDLETLMSKVQNKRANDYDTAAWFCYHTFLKDKTGVTFLEKAKKYCRDGWGLKNYSFHLIHAANLYRAHTQEILRACREL